MKTSWHGNAFCNTAPLWGESTGHWWIPSHSDGMQILYIISIVGINKVLNKQLSHQWFVILLNKQSSYQWFEMPWHLYNIILIHPPQFTTRISNHHNEVGSGWSSACQEPSNVKPQATCSWNTQTRQGGHDQHHKSDSLRTDLPWWSPHVALIVEFSKETGVCYLIWVTCNY